MPPLTVLFLFNHDATHQVAHLAGIVRALSITAPQMCIKCAVSSDVIRRHLEGLLDLAVISRIKWIALRLPSWLERLLELPNRVAPVRRLAILRYNAPALLDCDVLVSSERTCLHLRRLQTSLRSHARFVHIPHGAGDRAVSYHPSKAWFDRLLVSGDKTARELVAHNAATHDQLRIIGYPKFDTIDPALRLSLFGNDRPVFLYNPHFDPFLSSWYDEGPRLLDWFASKGGQRFNLVFAPHVMLFRKKLHVSAEYGLARFRPDIAPRWREASNILIDLGSERVVNMSYTLSADAYIGDVSSQIYEFLIRPRAVFFIDRFSQNARSQEAEYPAWSTGDVVSTVDELTHLIPNFANRAAIYSCRQRAVFADTMSIDPARSASVRAVDAILELANR